MLRWYQVKFSKQPILTGSVTSAVLFGSGDVLAQQLVDRKGFDKHDTDRTGRMVLYGGAIFGPAATTWYSFLQRQIILKTAKLTTIARVAADQCLFTPVHLSCFATSMAMVEGSDPIEKWQSTFLPSYKANLTIWPFVQAVNFTVVPPDYRVLFVNVVSLGWNCLLSMINNGD